MRERKREGERKEQGRFDSSEDSGGDAMSITYSYQVKGGKGQEAV